MNLTDKQVARCFRVVCRRIHRCYRGDPFGVDEQTLGVLNPGLLAVYRYFKGELRRRGLSGS